MHSGFYPEPGVGARNCVAYVARQTCHLISLLTAVLYSWKIAASHFLDCRRSSGDYVSCEYVAGMITRVARTLGQSRRDMETKTDC